jgi:hypothetical protein
MVRETQPYEIAKRDGEQTEQTRPTNDIAEDLEFAAAFVTVVSRDKSLLQPLIQNFFYTQEKFPDDSRLRYYCQHLKLVQFSMPKNKGKVSHRGCLSRSC